MNSKNSEQGKNSERIFAVLPAAGMSTRMGSECPKVLLPLGDKLVLEWSLAALQPLENLAAVVITAPAEHLAQFEKIDRQIDSPVHFIAGGQTRQESVRLALEEIRRRYHPQDTELVVIHDAARCLASSKLFDRCIVAAQETGASVAALPCVDTLKSAKEGFIAGSIDRDTSWAMQTPQVFRSGLLWAAHTSGKTGATDDVSLVQAMTPVRIVEGERTNIKLTTQDDYQLAKILKTHRR